MTCIITGCALVDPIHDRAVWGDLFRIGDCFIFHAAGHSGQAQWQYSHDAAVPNVMKSLTINSLIPLPGYFERERVIVIHHDWATLNKAALDYLKG